MKLKDSYVTRSIEDFILKQEVTDGVKSCAVWDAEVGHD
jgi:hypothetical protein